jgi:predicted acetyltransferase
MGIRLVSLDVGDPLLEGWITAIGAAFKDRPAPEPGSVEVYRKLLRPSRIRAAVGSADPLHGAPEQVVATFESFDTGFTVPGGSLPAHAVSGVTVLPTHRRQGLLSALMRADLAAAVAAGRSVAVLIASEGGIYGRFGFGAATGGASFSIDPRRARLRPEIARLAADGRCAVVPQPALRGVAPAVYDRARRPGATDRDDDWWDLDCGIVQLPGQDWKQPFAVVHRDADGVVDGYVTYRTERHDGEGPQRRVRFASIRVKDLQAATDQAYRALWHHLLCLDLVDEIRLHDAAVDEPLPWLLTDPRAARYLARDDFLWTRLLDPGTALSARRYEGGPGEIVLDVVDESGWAAGVITLSVAADGTGRAVASPAAAADLTLPVDVLSSLWLGGDGYGGSGIAGAVRAGRATELRPGAVARLSALLRTARAPVTTTWF